MEREEEKRGITMLPSNQGHSTSAVNLPGDSSEGARSVGSPLYCAKGLLEIAARQSQEPGANEEKIVKAWLEIAKESCFPAKAK